MTTDLFPNHLICDLLNVRTKTLERKRSVEVAGLVSSWSLSYMTVWPL